MVERDRVAGAALLAGAGLVVLVMAHHPTGFGSGIGQLVHGAMVVLVGVTAFGLFHVALGLGVRRAEVLAGGVAYGIAMFGHVGAATINGFAVPALVAHGVSDRGLFALAWELNQALAWLGVVATGMAYGLWSVAFARNKAWGVAAVGLVTGVVPVVLLGSGALRMNVSGATMVYALQMLWPAVLGWYLVSGRFARLNASRGM